MRHSLCIVYIVQSADNHKMSEVDICNLMICFQEDMNIENSLHEAIVEFKGHSECC